MDDCHRPHVEGTQGNAACGVEAHDSHTHRGVALPATAKAGDGNRPSPRSECNKARVIPYATVYLLARVRDGLEVLVELHVGSARRGSHAAEGVIDAEAFIPHNGAKHTATFVGRNVMLKDHVQAGGRGPRFLNRDELLEGCQLLVDHTPGFRGKEGQ